MSPDPDRGRRLYLLRHGEAAPPAPDGEVADPWQARLTPRGVAEIAELAGVLAGRGLGRLVTSEVPRALETAAILAGRTGLRPVVDAGWNELRAGEILAGSPEVIRRTVRAAYGEAGRPGARFLGGEPFICFARRVEQALDRLLGEPGWSRAALVTHEPALCYLLARCHGHGLEALGRFEVRTGRASILEWPAGADGIDTATPLIVNAAASDLPQFD